MPIYEYRCENGHHFEVIQSMSADPVTACEECGAPVERVFHPIAVHFKGSGFYNTDYKNKSKTGKDSKDSERRLVLGRLVVGRQEVRARRSRTRSRLGLEEVRLGRAEGEVLAQRLAG